MRKLREFVPSHIVHKCQNQTSSVQVTSTVLMSWTSSCPSYAKKEGSLEEGVLWEGESQQAGCVCVFPGFCPAACLPFTMNLRAGGPEMSTKERLRLGSEAQEHEGSSYSGCFSIFSSWRWRLCFLPLRAGTAAVP